jgi:F-type H+-transporting ATPase subunit a
VSDPVLFQIGPMPITGSLVTTWVIMLLLILGCLWMKLRLKIRPSTWQVVVEALVVAIRDQIRQIIRRDPDPYIAYVGTLGIFILVSNYAGLIPLVSSPTAVLNTPVALAITVLFAVPYFGIRSQGVAGYLKTYIKPNPIMLPFNIVSELSRTVSLAVRLFGNMMSGQIIGGVILILIPFFFPVVFHVLGMVTSLIQAYIFAILATVYIGAALRELEEKGGQK